MRILLALVILLMFSDQTMANKCQLPIDLKGKTLLFKVNGVYTPDNVLADMVIEYVFEEKTYQVTILNTRRKMSGVYDYRRLTPMLARFSVFEGSDEFASIYSQTLVCETNTTGFVIFSQTKGWYKPDIRQDTGVFIIDTQREKSE
ncbi:hypothetical protein [uncultured Shewanella sp.]|uniref:hypothetical protein n=1 Tax=uncultured Shewanella sp. TaxID=173975 RepID=UPI002639659B|nr:hypothetical protein [uncultured Shewanella sp.]